MSADKRGVSRALGALLVRPLCAGVGFGSYLALQPRVRIDLQEQVAPAMFAMAGVIGVFAGFAATAVVFIAGASGPGIEQIRLNHGSRLTNALLGAVIALMISAVGIVVCGLFANGWGAKGVAGALILAPTYDILLVVLALRTAINSTSTRGPAAQQECDL